MLSQVYSDTVSPAGVPYTQCKAVHYLYDGSEGDDGEGRGGTSHQTKAAASGTIIVTVPQRLIGDAI